MLRSSPTQTPLVLPVHAGWDWQLLWGTGLFLPFLALHVGGWGILWLHPSYRPGTQDEWGDISWGTSLLTEERLLNCLQGNRALALGKGCATSQGSEVLGKFVDLRVSGFSTQISSSHVSVSYCFSNKALILALRPTVAESLTSGALLLLWLSPGPRA